jgi:hypothetical protein
MIRARSRPSTASISAGVQVKNQPSSRRPDGAALSASVAE